MRKSIFTMHFCKSEKFPCIILFGGTKFSPSRGSLMQKRMNRIKIIFPADKKGHSLELAFCFFT